MLLRPCPGADAFGCYWASLGELLDPVFWFPMFIETPGTEKLDVATLMYIFGFYYDRGDLCDGHDCYNPPAPQSQPQASCPSTSSINAYLANTPLAGQGSNFMNAGASYDLEPRLLVSIAGAETSFGQSITAGQYNALNVLYSGFNSPFSSFQSNINAAARSLDNPRYDLMNTSTMYGTYCNGPGCVTGLNNINTFMTRQGALINSLHFPINCLTMGDYVSPTPGLS